MNQVSINEHLKKEGNKNFGGKAALPVGRG